MSDSIRGTRGSLPSQILSGGNVGPQGPLDQSQQHQMGGTGGSPAGGPGSGDSPGEQPSGPNSPAGGQNPESMAGSGQVPVTTGMGSLNSNTFSGSWMIESDNNDAYFNARNLRSFLCNLGGGPC
jgi:hypothetical protein